MSRPVRNTMRTNSGAGPPRVAPIGGVLLAVAGLLNGCAGGGAEPGTRLSATQFDRNARGAQSQSATDLHRQAEMLGPSSGVANDPCFSGSEGYVNVNVNGSASGPYPGSFSGDGTFFVRCGARKTSVSASFTIVSGTDTITGTISGPAYLFVNRFLCLARSSHLVYNSSLVRNRKIVRHWSGRASGEFGASSGRAVFHATLRAM